MPCCSDNGTFLSLFWTLLVLFLESPPSPKQRPPPFPASWASHPKTLSNTASGMKALSSKNSSNLQEAALKLPFPTPSFCCPPLRLSEMSCSRSPENTSCPAADWRPLLVPTLQPVLSLAISPSDVLAASVLTLTSHARLFCCCVNGLPIITTPPLTLVQEESTQKALGMGESRIYTVVICRPRGVASWPGMILLC